MVQTVTATEQTRKALARPRYSVLALAVYSVAKTASSRARTACALVVAVSGSAAAQAPLPAICSRATVDSVRAPLRHGQPGSPTFTYRYQFIPAVDPSSSTPTVVILPGGPGQAAIGNAETTLSLGALPPTLHRIYTDPRGTGCNAYEPLADTASLTTESLARDVIAVIKARQLNNYILYGASYGTVLATTTAALIEREGVTPPTAVVLEGVVGRAFPNFEAYMAAFVTEWNRVKPTLPNGWGERLSRDTLPFGYTAAHWGSLIAATLILGDLAMSPYEGPLLEYSLKAVDRYQQLKRDNALSQMTRGDSAAMGYVELRMGIRGGFAPSMTTQSRAELFLSIGCKELWGNWQSGRALVHGELVATGANICAAPKSNAFDSRAWQIRAPIYYFQGPFDPTSTLDGARYHYDNQVNARRTFVLVEGASHAPLTGGLRRCAPQIWRAIVDHAPMASALAGCPRRAEVRVSDSRPGAAPQ